ncbi:MULTISPECIES: hypothetical protein [unclassified Meiothermus]|uniref:hypothetical protein n=1 Tax=unclassified Meiothermus TaxID=370471 RepID=UPI000D7C1125|nr:MULTISPECIES: hypothetical protein [unclassified Meiothermus]PZA07641.1 hypothetical protein DNA98_04810 [Meiothermus sp. Pnk-1]RYM36478.1 hypothetical protein EWH23_09710 [Meiothermus sp. PNK-Is4]
MRWMLIALLALGGLGQAQSPLEFGELYSKTTIRGVEFSPKLQALAGKRVVMQGWMAPPLKPKLDFFVLTKAPLATCPFCSTAADWPPDIVLVIMPPGRSAEPTTKRIQVTGRLEVGIKTDEDTGFVSLVRIYADGVEEVR